MSMGMDLSDDQIRAIVNDIDRSEEERFRILDEHGVNPEEAFNWYRMRLFEDTRAHIIGTIRDESPPELEGSQDRWDSYLDYLREEASAKDYDPEEGIQSITQTTDWIIPYLRRSLELGRPTYGLVVGDVQSGKTANFCGLLSRACDHGISLVIVISGHTKVLRNQTQMRVDSALRRTEDGGNHDGSWSHLTSVDRMTMRRPIRVGSSYQVWESGDFYREKIDEGRVIEQISDSTTPCIMVVKKNKRTLERLLEWLDDHRTLLSQRQILIIDDEADSASVNLVRPNNGQGEDADFDAVAASEINRFIRSCIAISNRSTYIGYTATPYASLLADPWDYDEILGHSLYPRDFIVSLPQPSSHSGTREFFSEIGRLRHQVSEIHRDDVGLVNQDSPEQAPESLRTAIIDFFITGALKLEMDTDSDGFHHSMLVHCSVRKSNHEALEGLIREIVANITVEYPVIQFSGGRTQVYTDFKNRWENHFGEPPEREEVVDSLVRQFMDGFSEVNGIRRINSEDDEDSNDEFYTVPNVLDYDSHEGGLWVIAVGGTILSRGLTIEGLCVSYFTRETALYDTLTQMARWYGYHGSSEDLVRVYITDQIHRWFRWILQVEERIREDIQRYQSIECADPLTLAPRILRYVETVPLYWELEDPENPNNVPRNFMPTRAAAMTTSERRGAGFSGSYTSSRYLPLDEVDLLLENQATLESLLQYIGDSWTQVSGGYIAQSSPEAILDFLNDFHHEPGPRGIRREEVTRYIVERINDDELTNWTVALMSPQADNPNESELDYSMTGIGNINLTRRGKLENGGFDEIMDKSHVAVDLEGYPGNWARMPNIRRVARDIRTEQNGLLIIYVLDPNFNPTGGSRGFVQIFPEGDGPEVVAFGLALPDSDNALQAYADEVGEYFGPRGIPGESYEEE